jgi:hypothetical protein
VVHGRHVALFDHSVLLGKVGFGERLHSTVSLIQRPYVEHSRNMTTYSLVGSVADLLAHELVHPLVGLVVVAAVGRETGDDERHVWMFGCCMVLVLCNVVLSMS